MRDIKFRAWNKNEQKMTTPFAWVNESNLISSSMISAPTHQLMQYTGLKDKNGSGLTEVYEGDIIAIDGTLKGNIHENYKGPTDIVIPQLGTKTWESAYKEAVDRGYDYSE